MRALILILFILLSSTIYSQQVEVRAEYDADGNCIFSAYNNSKTPMYLHLDFADLQNTAFNETLPYVKRLEPGFNSLFTLQRYVGNDVPRFNYQLHSYRSDPTAIVDLDFPYLFPFAPGTVVTPVNVQGIEGFRGNSETGSWIATGFSAKGGEKVYASRQGEIVEIVGNIRGGDPANWYHTWNNSITLLHADGTLIVYRNIINKTGKLKLNQKVFAGELLGEVATGADKLILVIYQNSLGSSELRYLIPQFAVGESEIETALPSKTYTVVHPVVIRGREMSKKEKRKILGVR